MKVRHRARLAQKRPDSIAAQPRTQISEYFALELVSFALELLSALHRAMSVVGDGAMMSGCDKTRTSGRRRGTSISTRDVDFDAGRRFRRGATSTRGDLDADAHVRKKLG
jgi:hypothetical protein